MTGDDEPQTSSRVPRVRRFAERLRWGSGRPVAAGAGWRPLAGLGPRGGFRRGHEPCRGRRAEHGERLENLRFVRSVSGTGAADQPLPLNGIDIRNQNLAGLDLTGRRPPTTPTSPTPTSPTLTSPTPASTAPSSPWPTSQAPTSNASPSTIKPRGPRLRSTVVIGGLEFGQPMPGGARRLTRRAQCCSSRILAAVAGRAVAGGAAAGFTRAVAGWDLAAEHRDRLPPR